MSSARQNVGNKLDPVEHIEVYIVHLRQEKPYLGNLRAGETVNDSGYFVRHGNRTVYPRENRSLVTRVVTRNGIEGWGETYGLVAPRATAEIIYDLLRGFVIGSDPMARESTHDKLYDLMRVRGYTGGFYLDALAAIDIALWDIAGKQTGKSVSDLIGTRSRDSIAAYLSGLPEDTLGDRCKLATRWQQRGFDSFKFAVPVADDGPVAEFEALRASLGDRAKIAADLHWAYSPEQAISLAGELQPYCPWFLEAPVATEDINGLSVVARNVTIPIGVGEEWRTVHDARLRLESTSVQIVQPEMGHTGITEFIRICQCAQQHGRMVIPHATIGAGIFLAASLQASWALPGVVSHEYQHSVCLPFRHFIDHRIVCEQGEYSLPIGPGLGVEPSDAMRDHWELVAP